MRALLLLQGRAVDVRGATRGDGWMGTRFESSEAMKHFRLNKVVDGHVQNRWDCWFITDVTGDGISPHIGDCVKESCMASWDEK